MRVPSLRILFSLLPFICTVEQAAAARLGPETLAAWEDQVHAARSELEREAQAPDQFLSAQTLRFVIESPEPTGCPIPDGLIHHWFGTQLIPGAHVPELISVMQNYDAYTEIFPPAVVEAHLIHRDGDTFNYHLKLIQKGLGVRTGLLADFQSRYVQLDRRSGYIVAEAVRLTELQNPGKSNERQLSLAESRGFVERTLTIVRYRETDQGVLIRIESMTLSRDIPGSVRWVVAPFVHRFARQTMSSALERINDRVTAECARTVTARR